MLVLQFGQCGNQLGHAFFSKIAADIESNKTGISYPLNYEYTEETFFKWFGEITKSNKRLAKAILVDTEQKVINKIYNDTASWSYRAKNIICQTGGGSANNWAFGYTVKGPQLFDSIMEAIRQEIERTDNFTGFLFLLSSAGGTGSGVGSYIVEKLRDIFPTKLIISSIILPFLFGEICMQNYNSLLTLSKFHQQADLNLLFENEHIYSMCKTLTKTNNIELDDMNNIISQKLAATFQPVENKYFSLNSFISTLVSHPLYKFATIKSTPHIPVEHLTYESNCKWISYIRQLKQTLRMPSLNSDLTNAETKNALSLSNNTYYKYYKSVSNILVTRGDNQSKDIIDISELQLKDLYVDWSMQNRLTHLHQSRYIFGQNKFTSLITNSAQISVPLNILLEKAWKTYTYAAYLHQYKQFNLEENDFLCTFANIENVVKEYRDL